VAVSDGENPDWARRADIDCKSSFARSHAGFSRLATSPDLAPSTIADRSSLLSACNCFSDNKSERLTAEVISRSQLELISLSCCLRISGNLLMGNSLQIIQFSYGLRTLDPGISQGRAVRTVTRGIKSIDPV